MVVSLHIASPEDSAQAAGAALKELRLARRWTRKDLGGRAGVPVPTLRRFEETGLAPFLTVVRLARALARDDEIAQIFAPDQGLPDDLDTLLSQEAKDRDRRR
ncbi:hypothetical protein JANAI62_36410 [Jannaschia pagri]|uniref:HTH cro/C1-type domain-containing protein n=1 Tax=Jannaschia pagri TaxID=2829797 RepID=A0ABQ4NRH6_9RHOB|nr:MULTISPECIES: helix-turn-helix transcriptional regulator [unclassified Jannaschia]GIT93215.1 hypothetical protein JANAI61_36730 [Jannaschia sp. AI_61]GIT97018.1 hypothetical protein JANAI62_36410 [Jannaschia sp. AI_62]